MTGTDLSHEQPYGIRPVKRGSTAALPAERATRVKAAAAHAAKRADARLAALRAVTEPAQPRGSRPRRAA